MIVAEAVGRLLAAAGVDTAFGVVGSGNFHLTNALVRHGARFVAARHEGGAATMADAYTRMSGRVAVLTVHQGPGLTNAMTGIAEAAKSRTPLLVLAADVTEPHSNFHLDQAALARAVGAVPMRLTCAQDALEALRVARDDRRTVVLSLPLDIQSTPAPDWTTLTTQSHTTTLSSSPHTPSQGLDTPPPLPEGPSTPEARTPVAGLGAVSPGAAGSEAIGGGSGTGEDLPGVHGADHGAGEGGPGVGELVRLLGEARRPVFVAGRGARHARRELEDLADLTGALLATSAVARGLFRGSPWDLDVSGGFSTPLTAELISGADLVVAWGCALNMWTTRHGSLITPGTRVAQVDLEHPVAARHVQVDLPVTGEVARVAAAVRELLPAHPPAGYRSPGLARRIAAEGRWRAVPYQDETGEGRIDPRTLTIALDDILPAERVIAPDSGNFMGYPSMWMDVPDERGFCFTQAFQSIGLGLATAIGAALALPDRMPVAALGDGGALMGVSELETVARLGLPMVIVVYDDEAYGAEVHHFTGRPHDTVTFPPTDLAAMARALGMAAVTVTEPADLRAVSDWLDGPRDRAILVHAKITRERPSWWLEEAFKGH
ncbi:thiamine pyrophosphate-binding protein [Nonomuraea endophytica]|uniref:Thiamine pyrophosphate-dependent acetolactate synthase large subunit-like protein n=1 Tax=Nonomuraea endophytica TaxID=714136 RepID=A0A7W8A0L2_9ACTN|nr:thiamine pyrophosphate-binding protein [Nonomuraea endophytica]MBB5077323.1 thiamine pyrophosphate-dependent acetolactate synthase large subunit-like protein [Nonomuraea endophytica]